SALQSGPHGGALPTIVCAALRSCLDKRDLQVQTVACERDVARPWCAAQVRHNAHLKKRSTAIRSEDTEPWHIDRVRGIVITTSANVHDRPVPSSRWNRYRDRRWTTRARLSERQLLGSTRPR